MRHGFANKLLIWEVVPGNMGMGMGSEAEKGRKLVKVCN